MGFFGSWFVFSIGALAMVGLSWIYNKYFYIDPYAINVNDRVTRNEGRVTITVNDAGINSSILRSIPVVDFDSTNVEDGVECIICLSELVNGDKAKLLPNCNHWFHAYCINKWILSQPTCPICRKIVGSVPRSQGSRVTTLVVTQDSNGVVVDIPASPTGHISTSN